jgi:hypothetical protein
MRSGFTGVLSCLRSTPVWRPIPFYHYRMFKKSPTQQRADRIEPLAEELALPRAALEGNPPAKIGSVMTDDIVVNSS